MRIVKPIFRFSDPKGCHNTSIQPGQKTGHTFKRIPVGNNNLFNGRLKLTQKYFTMRQTFKNRLNHTSANNMGKMGQKLKLDSYQTNLKADLVKVFDGGQ